MADLRRLQRKYGQSTEEIIEQHEKLKQELEELENFDAVYAELEKKAEGLKKDLMEKAEILHTKRSRAIKVFDNSVNAELSDLNMKGVEFVTQIAKKNDELEATGFTDVEFATRNSKKEAPLPLSKAASGGELSRILLSLKNVVGDHDAPRTYLFDEVDTGVSGPTAEKVGKKLKSISTGQQVICVTHLPQVAAFADIHFFINKEAHKKLGTHMLVRELESGEKVEEIARLISGEKITKTSLEHARQLLDLLLCLCRLCN